MVRLPPSASITKGRKRLTFSPFFESGCRITAITLAFQARDEGSTPFTRSRLKKALQFWSAFLFFVLLFGVGERFFAAHSAQRWSQKRNRLGVSIPKNVKISLEAQAIRLNPNFYIEKRDTSSWGSSPIFYR